MTKKPYNRPAPQQEPTAPPSEPLTVDLPGGVAIIRVAAEGDLAALVAFEIRIAEISFGAEAGDGPGGA